MTTKAELLAAYETARSVADDAKAVLLEACIGDRVNVFDSRRPGLFVGRLEGRDGAYWRVSDAGLTYLVEARNIGVRS